MELTTEQLIAAVIGCSAAEAQSFLPGINEALRRYNINTRPRVAHFLAQIGHESNGFNAVREYDSGEAYEGRKDLGNIEKGDGVKFKGRGLIQITGRTNYKALGAAFGVDLIDNPLQLESPRLAALSAGWYWNSRNINALADKDTGAWNDSDKAIFIRITKAINGGINGWEDRQARYLHAYAALA